jgi:hypothetical protein
MIINESWAKTLVRLGRANLRGYTTMDGSKYRVVERLDLNDYRTDHYTMTDREFGLEFGQGE